jgi:hypothetical protein
MNNRLNKKDFESIKKKVDSSDSIRYLVGKALFEEDAGADMKLLISEVESCWKEIKELNEGLRLLTKKTVEAQRRNQST